MKIDLYHGDCLEVMKQIIDGSIDITVTSPPYNLGNKHHTGNKSHNPYHDNLPEKEYQEQQIEILNEIYRLTKDDGSILYNHKNRIKNGTQITPYEWILKTNWVIKQEIVWFNGSQNFDKIRFYPMTERVYWLAKSSKTKLINTINHHDLFNKSEWKPEGINKAHTRSYPEKLVEDLLLCFPNSNNVFDPYMGSGTTGKVAKKLNRNFIGIELDEQYFNIAKQRINNTEIKQQSTKPVDYDHQGDCV
jgi:modification methylase